MEAEVVDVDDEDVDVVLVVVGVGVVQNALNSDSSMLEADARAEESAV